MLILPFFFFNDTATTEIYTLSLHDALPISLQGVLAQDEAAGVAASRSSVSCLPERDRKSTRLNSSHSQISYAVFCLKKKNVVLPGELHTRIYSRARRILKF